MTGHQINSLVGDLVAMAQAMEKLPHVEAECARLQQASIADGERIARLELRLQERNEEITSLHQRIAEVTKERDDFGFRHLEEVDKTNALLLAIRNATGSLGQAVNVVDPPKPESKVVDHAAETLARDTSFEQIEQSATMGERVADPTSAHTHDSNSLTTPIGQAHVTDASTVGNQLTEGQSASHPTTENLASDVGSQGSDTSGHVTTAFVPEGANISQSEPLPYAGKRYYDEPGTISRERWLALGGTNESYDWRPWAQGEVRHIANP